MGWASRPAAGECPRVSSALSPSQACAPPLPPLPVKPWAALPLNASRAMQSAPTPPNASLHCNLLSQDAQWPQHPHHEYGAGHRQGRAGGFPPFPTFLFCAAVGP